MGREIELLYRFSLSVVFCHAQLLAGAPNFFGVFTSFPVWVDLLVQGTQQV